MNLNVEELERTERKRKANLVDEVDVIRAEDAVRIAKQNKVLIESRWKAVQAELAVLTNNDEFKNMSPEYNLFKIPVISPLDQSIASLKEKSRLLKTLQIRLDQLELVQKGYKETEKASLNFFTQMNTKNLDDKVAESLKMDKYDVIVGLQFQVPLEKRTAKFNIDKTELQKQQLRAQYDELVLTLTSALTNLHIQMQEMEDVLKLNQDQIESAKRKTEEELKLYNQGRGSLTFVIQSRDSEERAKLLYTQNALLYHQLLIQYKSLMDEIL
jgi:outer membrane protein TolC